MILDISEYVNAVLVLITILTPIFLTFFWLSIVQSLKSYSFQLYENVQIMCKRSFASISKIGLGGTKIILSGDIEQLNNLEKKKLVIISNHKTDSDWYFIWQLLEYLGKAQSLSILLKSSIKKIPIIGTAIRNVNFIFLERNWEKDEKTIKEFFINSLNFQHYPIPIIFPEGTTINLRSLKKSQDYSKEKIRPVFKNVLLPRTTGLTAVLESLSSIDNDNTIIIDLTTIYDSYRGILPEWGYSTDDEPNVPTLQKLLMGLKTKVHYIIHTTPLSELNLNKNKSHDEKVGIIEKWLDNEWSRKEKELQYYIDNQKVELENVKDKCIEFDLKYTFKLGDLLFVSVPTVLAYVVIHLLPIKVTLLVITALIVFGVFIARRSLKE